MAIQYECIAFVDVCLAFFLRYFYQLKQVIFQLLNDCRILVFACDSLLLYNYLTQNCYALVRVIRI